MWMGAHFFLGGGILRKPNRGGGSCKELGGGVVRGTLDKMWMGRWSQFFFLGGGSKEEHIGGGGVNNFFYGEGW